MLKRGQKVWYSEFSGKRRPAVIVGFGEKESVPVVSVKVEDATNKFDANRWGYEDQIEPRS